MKKILLGFLFLAATVGYSQSGSGFGIKGGLNYAGTGDYFESADAAAQDPDRKLGYHLGVFAKTDGKLYFRPELIYTSISSSYENDDFKMQKLDAPLLVGFKVLGPVNVFGGPSLQYVLDTEFDNFTIGEVENDFTVGLNFGIGLSLGKLGIDLRYERGFGDNEVRVLDANGILNPNSGRIDTRPEQLILSFSLSL